MSVDGFDRYIAEVQTRLDEARGQAAGSIELAARTIADAQLRGRPLFVFGATHAGLLAQDLYYRAGGLMLVEAILPAGLMLNERPVTRTSLLERLPGYGTILLEDVPLLTGDVLLVISVSGRNPVPVELATAASNRGVKVIALTSMTYSNAVSPRGSARLHEVADQVIDLPGIRGDAAISLDGLDIRVGPTSTAVGSAILQGLVVRVAELILAAGSLPEIYVSGNLDHGDSANRRASIPISTADVS